MISHTKTRPNPGHADSYKAVLQTGDETITVTGFRTKRAAVCIGWAITGVLRHLAASSHYRDRIQMTIHTEDGVAPGDRTVLLR